MALYDVIASFIVDYIIESQLIFLHPKTNIAAHCTWFDRAVALIGNANDMRKASCVVCMRRISIKCVVTRSDSRNPSERSDKRASPPPPPRPPRRNHVSL